MKLETDPEMSASARRTGHGELKSTGRARGRKGQKGGGVHGKSISLNIILQTGLLIIIIVDRWNETKFIEWWDNINPSNADHACRVIHVYSSGANTAAGK